MSIKKSDIAKKISSEASLEKSLSKDIVSSFIEIIKSNLSSSNIKIANFGTFKRTVTPQRIGRNPKTGEEHVITKRIKPTFVVSKKVKEKLN